MKVTFDSNAWQPVVRPDKFPKHPDQGEFLKIQAALRDNRVQGFISETVATLEGIRRADRSSYVAARRPKVDFKEEATANAVKVQVTISPDNSQHPGLAPVLSDRLKEAVALGIRLLRAPRLAVPRPADLLNPDIFAAPPSEPERVARLERFGQVVREIEARGVGRAVAVAISARIQARLGATATPQEPWFQFFNRAKDPAEESEISKAVAEWADGDTVAVHVAYGNDLLCTEDKGRTAGAVSVFDVASRAWLATTYGVKFVSLSELAVMI